MFKIVHKEILNPKVKKLVFEAPYIARKAKPGQFVILRTSEDGERIPLTIADYDREKGTVSVIFQEVGKTTTELGALNEGDTIPDLAGPLGRESHFDNVKKAVVIGGGLGVAIAYPQAKYLKELGADVHFIAGFRNKELIFLEEEMKTVASRAIIATDDGSNGVKGFVTNILQQLIDEGNKYDLVVAIGPAIMMKAVSELTRPYGIKTIVSLNPIMIDGTGMCGGCRVTVGGETKFACVDGPDFDGHQVDFDSLMKRLGMYKAEEKTCSDRHACRLEGMNNG
jgi:ferredoxin--NADP+ reductase